MATDMKKHFLMANIGTLGVDKDRPFQMSRYMGGHKRYTQPYVSGYWYFMILTPDVIFAKSDISIDPVGSSATTSEIIPPTPTDLGNNFQTSTELWFHSAAESFTPPTTNLTKIDIPAMGGIGSSFIGGREITRTFTVTFREYTNLPIMSALRAWNSALDPYLGVSPLQANQWVPNAYKGVACAFLCKPTVSSSESTSIDFDVSNQDKTDVEQLYFFDGVWPETAPDDSFNTDIATNDSLQLSVTFSFDGWAYTKEVFERQIGKKATDLFAGKYSLNNIIYHIKNNVIPGANLT